MKINPDLELLEGGRKLPLVEDFYTIQGEGFHAGKPAYFIRLGGCDVGCRWCDAKYTWNPRVFPPVDVDVVVERAKSCEAQAIVITGGEPLLYPLDILTSKLKEAGLDGIEGYYSEYTPEMGEKFRKMAKELDLLLSGGSDFHAAMKPHIAIGSGINGTLSVDGALLERIRERAAEQKN
jgi:organic radical activating enzyme